MPSYDVKAHIIGYLTANTSVKAYGQVPATRPQRFITVELTGESSDIWRDSPTLAVQCWAGSDSEAAALSLEVKAAMQDFQYEGHIRKVSQNSRYSFPDPDSRQARYQIVYDLVVQN